MKIYSLLILAAITLAFFSGRMAFMVKNEDQMSKAESILIDSFVQEMRERTGTVLNFNLSKDYKNQSFLELLTPKTSYTNSYIPLNSAACIKAFKNTFSHKDLKKEDVWTNFRCRLRPELPQEFFESSPYIHPSGKSYAYLAFKDWYNRYGSMNPFNKYIKYFHVSELNELKLDLPPVQNFLSKLSSDDLMRLTNRAEFLIANDHLIVGSGMYSYSIYSMNLVNNFFKRNGYKLTPLKRDHRCFYQMDQVCVSKIKESIKDRLSNTTYIIFIAALFILLITVSNLYNRIEKQNKEEEKKKHALRVLTHELRTPVTSLLLQIDSITSNPDEITPFVQEKLLRLESDIYRLKHLAEKSRAYLQSNSSKLIQFNNIELSSLNEFILDCIDETYDGKMEINFTPTEDISIKTDPYWTGICLINLIENAKRYGKGPIEISFNIKNENINISVLDYGNLQANSLKTLSKKSNQGQHGMGIGLDIVQKTLKEMGGDLRLQTSPTKFTMSIPNKKRKNE